MSLKNMHTITENIHRILPLISEHRYGEDTRRNFNDWSMRQRSAPHLLRCMPAPWAVEKRGSGEVLDTKRTYRESCHKPLRSQSDNGQSDPPERRSNHIFTVCVCLEDISWLWFPPIPAPFFPSHFVKWNCPYESHWAATTDAPTRLDSPSALCLR